MAYAATKEWAHELVERMPVEKVPELVGVLERMVEPVRLSLVNAPFEDEAVSEDENREAAEARARGYAPSATSHEDLLKEFGLSLDDFERMSHEPVEDEVPTHRG
jgi:hypothetical protein